MILVSASDLWQQLVQASELYLLYERLDSGSMWLVDFDAVKSQLVSFHHSDNCVAIDVKMDGPVPDEESFFKMLVLSFCSKFDWLTYITCIAKTTSKKVGALICSLKFLSSEVAVYLYKSTT